jgi:hypothetical protein
LRGQLKPAPLSTKGKFLSSGAIWSARSAKWWQTAAICQHGRDAGEHQNGHQSKPDYRFFHVLLLFCLGFLPKDILFMFLGMNSLTGFGF